MIELCPLGQTGAMCTNYNMSDVNNTVTITALQNSINSIDLASIIKTRYIGISTRVLLVVDERVQDDADVKSITSRWCVGTGGPTLTRSATQFEYLPNPQCLDDVG